MSDVESASVMRPIRWQSPDEVETKLATHIVVQHTEHEFILSFFEIKPPIIVGTPEQREKQAQDLSFIQAHCVARIAITPGRMEDFLELMASNMEKFRANVKSAEREAEE